MHRATASVRQRNCQIQRVTGPRCTSAFGAYTSEEARAGYVQAAASDVASGVLISPHSLESVVAAQLELALLT
ncbi:MAG TPA: hypothetical protein VIV60_33680 [Polyangiaceae bacterium]